MTAEKLAVVAEGLRKTFSGKEVLSGVDLEVPSGTVCGVLGPNGAGKTTTVRILATLLRPTAGRALVGGYDVVKQADQVRHRIGLVGQNAAVDEVLSGYENLVMFGRLFHLTAAQARSRARELLQLFDLTETGSKAVKAYSGGMRRRLDLAASMILTPVVLFLDEPTVGLDPRGRNEVWAAMRNLVAQGTTVLLTTQYLDEADQLAGQIYVIDTGKVIASGTPTELKARLGGDRLDVVIHRADELHVAADVLSRAVNAQSSIDQDSRTVSAPVGDRVRSLTESVRALETAGVMLDDIALRRPTLDEVFLHLTGHAVAPGAGEPGASHAAGGHAQAKNQKVGS